MLALLGRIFGPALLGWIAQWFGRRERDALIVKAAEAERAGKALLKNKKDAADAAKTDADVKRLPDGKLDDELRRFSRKREP